MIKKVVIWVEVRFVEGDFFSIDFGDFAITVFREINGFRIVINRGKNYEEDYWSFLLSLDSIPYVLDYRKIEPESFKKIQYIVKGIYRPSPTKKQFWEFLISVFPDCEIIFAN